MEDDHDRAIEARMDRLHTARNAVIEAAKALYSNWTGDRVGLAKGLNELSHAVEALLAAESETE